MTKSKSLPAILAVSLTLLVVLFVLPTTAGAVIPYSGTVVNAAGVPQAGVTVYDATWGTDLGTTDGNGNYSVGLDLLCIVPGAPTPPWPWNLEPACEVPAIGDDIHFSRSEEGSTDPCTSAPEGWPGVSMYATTAPGDVVFSGFVVHVPSIAGTPYQPALSNEELGLVGAINQERVDNGLTPVTISSVLTASADKYLSDLPNRPLDPSADATYCMASGPGLRAADAGFPTTDDINEDVLQNSPNAYTAMTSMENYDNAGVLSDTITMIGVAQEGNTWVIDTSDLPANDPYYKRAGDTGNLGNYSLVSSEFPVATDDDTADDTTTVDDGDDDTTDQPVVSAPHAKASQLKFAGVVTTPGKHQVSAHLTLTKKAKGSVRVVAVKKSNHKIKVILHSKRNKNKVRVWGHLGHGDWILKAHFLPSAGTRWQALTIRHIIHVK